MRGKWTNSLLVICGGLFFLSLAACGGGSDNNPPPLSGNSRLAGIELAGATLSPEFSAETTAYTAEVGFATAAISVTCSNDSDEATLKIDGTSIASGGTFQVDLAAGETVIVVEVTAANGTNRSYTITVSRPGVALSPASVNLNSGRGAMLSVRLTAPANGDTEVTLGTSTHDVTLPATVTVANGSSQQEFEVLSVAADTVTATITATLNGDSATATINVIGASCGDGIIGVGEQCDDANANLGDGCSACMIGSGWDCSGEPSVCTTTCGDGIVAGTELCDDGLAVGGDGCSSTCNFENGWGCAGTPSVCAPVCGDGLVTGTEQCDDGNLDDNDFCSNACLPVSHDCDDGIACTTDSFDVGSHSCQHVPNDGLCNDGNLCTADSCNPASGCEYLGAPRNGTSCDDGNACSTSDVCTDGACTGGAPVICNDSNICTSDSCNPVTGCGYTPVGDGTFCAGGTCDSGSCQLLPVTCSDTVKNGDETGVDCGGACLPCVTGGGCSTFADCQSGICTGGICQAPTCGDAVKNGSETDVDCGGGVCPACSNGATCDVSTDCRSQVCSSGICQVPTCSDGVRNGVETGVDCGNGCPSCATGAGCDDNTDCQSGTCTGGVCQ